MTVAQDPADGDGNHKRGDGYDGNGVCHLLGLRFLVQLGWDLPYQQPCPGNAITSIL